MTFSARELEAITAALYVAAKVADSEAANASAALLAMREAAGLPRAPRCLIAAQFERQAAEWRVIAERINNPKTKETHR